MVKSMPKTLWASALLTLMESDFDSKRIEGQILWRRK